MNTDLPKKWNIIGWEGRSRYMHVRLWYESTDSPLFVAGKKYHILKSQERTVQVGFVLFLELQR